MGDSILIDVEKVLSRLKPFQRKSVEYVFERMYGPDPTHRFLLADEVGLGKTLVARGLIAKAIEHLRQNNVSQIDIIYICSNQEIARQNLNRLNPTNEKIHNPLERITLLPRLYKGESPTRNRKLNFIAITPGTSLDPKSGGGRWEERILIYHMLKEAWKMKGVASKNIFQLGCATERFRFNIDEFESTFGIDTELKTKFIKAIEEENKKTKIVNRFRSLSEKYTFSVDERRECRNIVIELRKILAKTCVHYLQPDLIILDEFQRFKYLLNEDSEESQLAHTLFEYSDEYSKARVLLLSATPYKMYTMGQESEEENHYVDFISTLKFLLKDEHKIERIEVLLRDYRQKLYRIEENEGEIRKTRDELESILHSVISRTERLAVTDNRNGMLKEMPVRLKLDEADIKAYLETQKIAKYLRHSDIMEFWKSAPYLLSFMEEYAIKSKLMEKSVGKDAKIELIEKQKNLFFPWNKYKRYAPIAPLNPRLKSLYEKFINSGNYRCLWVPASLPYYSPAGAFSKIHESNFTKILVFSSWRVVPKAVASLLSYEVERSIMKGYDPSSENTAEARGNRNPLLNFARANTEGSRERLTGMPILTLIYPSLYLASKYDPLAYFKEKGAMKARVEEIIDYYRNLIINDIQPLIKKAKQVGPEDESWYWAAPILLDQDEYPKESKEWWGKNESLGDLWSGRSEGQSSEKKIDESDSAWNSHVEEARGISVESLGRPPADLATILAQMALAGPAIVSLRSLARVSLGMKSIGDSSLRIKAGAMGWSFRALFNTPEAIALIRGEDSREPFWRRVLEYCVNGNLQSTMDEFVHILKDVARIDGEPNQILEDVCHSFSKAISIRIANPGVDRIWIDKDKNEVKKKNERLRCRFAMRYGDEQAEDGTAFRADSVRQAFNSPFWPFVLITTSVGQEGLDFHPYCHAVAHWNLPGNPVDLEQREGRIHRFKGHAIRRNVAVEHGKNIVGDHRDDPWEAMFAAAEGLSDDDQGLKPYWVYHIPNGACIERHVMALPLSKESERLPYLRRSLAVYRMVFGQPRQDDLLDYLMSKMPQNELVECLQRNKIDLSPANRR